MSIRSKHCCGDLRANGSLSKVSLNPLLGYVLNPTKRPNASPLDSGNRPLSPHLQVYRFQLTSVLSITHRISGVVLSLGAVVWVLWLIAVASGPEAYLIAQRWGGSFIGQVALLGWTVALFYHLCNGVRHLAWDLGYGFELPTVYRSGRAVIIGCLLLTAVVWIVGYSV